MSTVSSSTLKGPIHLHYDGGQVLVTPEDQDRFVMASWQAVSACESVLARRRIADQFRDEFLTPLHAWCAAHRERISQCYVPFGSYGNCIKVFVVAITQSFDSDLSDSIADLEAGLQDKGWACDILQIARGEPAEVRAFFDPEHSIQVFGDGRGTPASRES